MPVVNTKGAASSQGFGEFTKNGGPAYIEDVFSTYLYTGNGTTQTINNGIDLSTKGGMVWIKGRSIGSSNQIFDTNRGAGTNLQSDNTAFQSNNPLSLSSFNSNGFSLGSVLNVNWSTYTFASWTFRKQPKFFDVVTYTGTGSARTIAHSLGAVPGCIIVKRTDALGDWPIYHNGLANSEYVRLNDTSIANTNTALWNSTTPTSTVFTVGTDTSVNASGGTYVAYVFAHNAGGFGLTGTDNVISCGSFTGNGSATGPVVTLGYEPQLVLIKKASGAGGGDWHIFDVMRGWSVAGNTADLNPSTSYAESSSSIYAAPNATGFQVLNTWTDLNQSGSNYIYIAIRRGPMRTPTDATKVFSPISQTGGGTVTTNFPVDLSLSTPTSGSGNNRYMVDRLRGTTTAVATYLNTNLTNAENTTAGGFGFDNNTGYIDNGFWGAQSIIYLNFQRAPGFFDEVCYTGTGSALTVNHNLGVAPELVIVKNRAPTGDGREWSVTFNFGASTYSSAQLNQTSAASSIDYSNGGNPLYCSAAPTSTTFSIGKNYAVSYPSNGHVAYLFATIAKVSKVGTYTGNGTTQTINCGFTGGARFVLIKRTDSTGDWYVYDTARGMTTVTDPYFFLNSTAAPAATLGSVTTVSTGFALNAAILAAINTSAATYIFLAIA